MSLYPKKTLVLALALMIGLLLAGSAWDFGRAARQGGAHHRSGWPRVGRIQSPPNLSRHFDPGYWAGPGDDRPETGLDRRALQRRSVAPCLATRLWRGRASTIWETTSEAVAGTVDDPFYIDLCAFFDTANLRTPVLGGGDDEDQDGNIGDARDDVSGFNVNSIAIEVSISMVTTGKEPPSADEPRATISVWGTTSRPNVRVLDPSRAFGFGSPNFFNNNFVQI